MTNGSKPTAAPSKSGFVPQPAEIRVSLNAGQIATAEARGLTVKIGLPPHGVTQAMRPTEALMTALGGCIIANVAIACRTAAIPWEGISLILRNEDARDLSRIARILVEIDAGPVSDESRHNIINAVRQGSRIFKTLAHGVDIALSVADYPAT